MGVSTELAIVLIALLIAIGILIYNPSKFLGIPSFMIFMGIGLFLGNGNWGDPVYDNPKLTEFLSSIALNIIIFVGGFKTSIKNIKVAFKEGLVLSTLGVLLTAVILGYLTYLVTDLPLLTAILFGAIVSSTDAAVVFGILDAKKLKLKYKTDTILEFESATNDPMALILVTIFSALVMSNGSNESGLIDYSFLFLKLLGIGGLIGLVFGWITKKLLEKITFQESGLVPIFILALFFVTTYSSDLLGGNLLISSYIFGVITGNGTYKYKETSTHFNNSLSWLGQSLMFLFLGLEIFPNKLGEVFIVSLLPAFFLIILARPIAVLICYLPFRSVPWGKRLFISSIGLKGATPIVFAFIPLLMGVPNSETIFHMVFYVVIYSVVIQGVLLEPLAKRFNLIDD